MVDGKRLCLGLGEALWDILPTGRDARRPAGGAAILRCLTLLVLAGLATGCKPRIEIVTDPPGAEVYFDNEHLGPSPVQTTYPASPRSGMPEMHVVEARMPGYLPGIEYVTERPPMPGSTKRVHMTLTPSEDGMAGYEADPIRLFGSPEAVSAYLSWVVCDVRLVRVSDGKVVAAAGELGRQEELDALLIRLTTRMDLYTHATGRLAVLPVRNRRNSVLGRDLAAQATDLLTDRARWTSRTNTPPVRVTPPAKRLRRDLDDPRVIREKPIARQLENVDYVIQAGLAESIIP